MKHSAQFEIIRNKFFYEVYFNGVFQEKFWTRTAARNYIMSEVLRRNEWLERNRELYEIIDDGERRVESMKIIDDLANEAQKLDIY